MASQPLSFITCLHSSAKLARQTPTYLAFQRNGALWSLKTTVTATSPIASLDEANSSLFKAATESDHVVITSQTIFHPQGGGQPSDVGSMKSTTSDARFNVLSVRMDALMEGQVLHFGRFASPDSVFLEGEVIEQEIDADARNLYSRLHTAGHVLGAAVRHLLEDKVDGFDELKASHFPDSAACEFQGVIEGKWKGDIQKKVDEYVDKAMPVEIDWWDKEDFVKEGLERLIPEKAPPAGEKWRVVKIVGAEVYPCGGTHVATTDLCGKTTVKKISRSKGTSRVSYNL